MKTNNFPAEAEYTGIHLFNETDFSLPVDESVVRKIAALIHNKEGHQFKLVEIVCVDEEEIIRLNQEHLDRSYVTDIISFGYDEDVSQKAAEGTLFCCLSRIIEQANEYNVSAEQEFKRIIIHGLLHLAGYKDKTDAQQRTMQQREDYYLGLID